MVIQSFKMAMKAILANKVRTFLTMLGIIIGVLALVVLVSLVTSATSSITDDIEDMGTDMLSVSVMDDKGTPLTEADLENLKQSDSISLVAPTLSISATASYEGEQTSVAAEGTSNSYFSIMGSKLLSGRTLKQTDLDNASYVTVISYEAAEEIYGNPNVLGRTLSMNGRSFEIVGVLEENDSVSSGMGSGYTTYIPFSVAKRMSDSDSGISTFYASATSAEQIDAAESAVDNFMLEHLDNDEEAYMIMNQSVLAETMESVTSTFALLLGGIAGISLLVGGIGIMNIMLVSVTERTREIGIRKAIGAKRRSILIQFIIEALVICLLGCLIAVAFALLIIGVLNLVVTSMTFSVSIGVILVAIVFSTLIGLLFGVYPARKAARMNPIDALRYE